MLLINRVSSQPVEQGEVEGPGVVDHEPVAQQVQHLTVGLNAEGFSLSLLSVSQSCLLTFSKAVRA